MYQVLALCVCVSLSLEITHPYSQRVFFIPSFVLSSFSDDDDVFWIIRPFFKAMRWFLFSSLFKRSSSRGRSGFKTRRYIFVDLNDVETIVSSDLVF